MNRRAFLQFLTALGLNNGLLSACQNLQSYYQIPLKPGSIRLLHITDTHAQLLPMYYREPTHNIAVGKRVAKPPHLSGQAFLDFFGLAANSRSAYALTALDFTAAAEVFGKMGGYAHLATLIQQLREQVGAENCLLLDGGDSWQGSATALWTKAGDMLQAANYLGVDAMTGHWEFTYGAQQLKENIQAFNGQWLAHNVNFSEEAQFARDSDEIEVFKPYMIRQLRDLNVAVIGQAFPYTPIANPGYMIPEWQFGIHEQQLQKIVNQLKDNRQADVIVLLSHNGMDVDLKLAAAVNGLDFILGGHTHDAIPSSISVKNPGGITQVSNAGSHGKFVGVLDIHVQGKAKKQFNYRLLPVFSRLLPADVTMQKMIDTVRQPYLQQLQKPLAVSESLLYRRDNFYGSFDQLILNALMQKNASEIAFSPGFRWGTCVLPGQTITFEDVMNMTAITYPETYRRTMSGLQIKQMLEDVCDNLFNDDPYYRQGGDMVRVGGLQYRCRPNAKAGQRIVELRTMSGNPLQANKNYTVSGWATVQQASSGRPVWQLLSEYLQEQEIVNVPEQSNILLQ